MRKFIPIGLISILLISYSNSADCTSKSTEASCKEDSNCEWSSASCSGHSTCTSKTTSDECGKVTYPDVTCTFTAAKDASCTGGNDCGTKTTENDCTSPCEWNDATAATCTGGSSCTQVTSPTTDTCNNASTTKKCSWNAGSCKSKTSSNSDKLKSSALVGLAFLLL